LVAGALGNCSPTIHEIQHSEANAQQLEREGYAEAEEKDPNTEMGESFWDLFAVVEEQDEANKVE
jgi:hypothetical protein